jgi:endonuclease/exonuclease/phosphatase family metal-dependent hydrolase
VFRAATFNAGLAVGMLPNATERLPHVIEALAALDVDLLFVQEFWLDRHWQALESALRPRLPVALRLKAVAGAGQPCTLAQLAPLKSCAEAHCGGLRDEALARCVIQRCAAIGLQLPSDCLNCIASNPEGSLDDILGRCTAAVDPPAELGDAGARERTGGELIAYGGSFGTGLLLKEQPLAKASIVFESTINARGATYARIANAVGAEPLHVFAAHLSPGGTEQGPQVTQLLEFIDDKAGTAPALLLGDLNLTPGSALFERLTRSGFREGNVLGDRGTYSGEGLESGRFGTSAWRLDHALLRGTDAELVTKRILDDPVLLDAGGRPTRSTLSDHAGLLVTITTQSE